jgi:hypothetical protein
MHVEGPLYTALLQNLATMDPATLLSCQKLMHAKRQARKPKSTNEVTDIRLKNREETLLLITKNCTGPPYNYAEFAKKVVPEHHAFLWSKYANAYTSTVTNFIEFLNAQHRTSMPECLYEFHKLRIENVEAPKDMAKVTKWMD